jgi:hypothetical protein
MPNQCSKLFRPRKRVPEEVADKEVAEVKQRSCSRIMSCRDSSNGAGAEAADNAGAGVGAGVGASGAGTGARAAGAASCSSSRRLQVHQEPELLSRIQFGSATRCIALGGVPAMAPGQGGGGRGGDNHSSGDRGRGRAILEAAAAAAMAAGSGAAATAGVLDRITVKDLDRLHQLAIYRYHIDRIGCDFT